MTIYPNNIIEINTINQLFEKSNTYEIYNIHETYECAICLTDIIVEDALLSCNHLFHVKCILKWSKCQIKKHNPPSCPLCRIEYNYTQFAKNVLNNNSKLIKNIISKLKYIINNTKLSFINYFHIKLVIYKFYIMIHNIKYEKDPLNSYYFNNMILQLPPTIEQIYLNTNFNKNSSVQEPDLIIKKCRRCCDFLC